MKRLVWIRNYQILLKVFSPRQQISQKGKRQRKPCEENYNQKKVENYEDTEYIVEGEPSEESESEESFEQFRTPSKKVDTEITLNFKSPLSVKVDKEITLNIGKDSPKTSLVRRTGSGLMMDIFCIEESNEVKTPGSKSRHSSRSNKGNTPRLLAGC